MNRMIVAPSTDPCPLSGLQEYVHILAINGADWLHCDIMDGKFVTKQTFDDVVLSLISKRTNLVLDVHLMVDNPKDKIAKYVEAGANHITIHFEAFDSTLELINTLQYIRSFGVKVGLSLKPSTNVKDIFKFLPMVDICLVMSVEPGKSGQEFIKDSLTRIVQINEYRKSHNLNFLIEVDGGVNESNVKSLKNIGVDAVVAGSAIYNSNDRAKTIDMLKCM